MKERHLYKIALQCFALAAAVVLFFSCLSFDIGDSPSGYLWPHNSPAKNWCGPIGAFFAYYLMYYIGPGVFLILASVAAGSVVKLANKKISQPILRFLGMLLLTVAVSASVYLFWPHTYNSVPLGNGGVLGVGAAIFLKSRFAGLGTFLIMASAAIVGSILLADAFVLNLLRWSGLCFVKSFGAMVPVFSVAKVRSKSLGQIWQRLSMKKSQPTLAEVLAQEAEEIEQRESADSKIESHLNHSVGKPVTTDPDTEAANTAYVPKSYEDYELPGLDLLINPEQGFSTVQDKIVRAKSAALEQVLREFGIDATVASTEPGPTITMFELSLAAGIKVSQISNLSNDIARALGAAAVRVVAPLPGRHTIGIEVPNSQKETVRMKDLLILAGNRPDRMQIPLFLGKDSSGEALVSDLAAMPHLLIAGTTGSGKSVCINSIITSIMMLKRPDEVKLILIDPKMVELAAFARIPHLMSPIITEVSRAEQILEWATTKMDERYALLAEAGVRNIASFNKLGAEEVITRLNPATSEEEAKIPKRLPYFVIIVDELADLMMTAAKEIEAYIVRLAQKSRAVGIHIVLATQRPQATVVTGLIKSNLPSRVSFRVASRIDSRIVLDQNGAETLLGHGDMLFLKPGSSDVVRAQGAFVDDDEIKRIVGHLTEIADPQFHPELMQLNKVDVSAACSDDMFDEAVRTVLETKRGSVSLLQRKLSVGYARASRMIEAMASSGILGEYKGSQAREVLLTLEEYERTLRDAANDERGHEEDADDFDEDASDESVEYDYVAVDDE